MENPENKGTQKTPEEIIKDLEAQVADLKPKADASSQNFERLKKAEQELKDLKEGKTPPEKLEEKGTPVQLDPAKLKQEIEDRVSLRLAGRSPEQIEEIERYARGANISLIEASKVPFVAKAVEALEAESKSTENTPAPSSKVKVFNGKPIEETFKSGTSDEKQKAFEAKMKGGVKGNE